MKARNHGEIMLGDVEISLIELQKAAQPGMEETLNLLAATRLDHQVVSDFFIAWSEGTKSLGRAAAGSGAGARRDMARRQPGVASGSQAEMNISDK